MNKYQSFLKEKAISHPATGLENIGEINPMLFPFQRDIVKWALRRGRAAIFADCGLGKTPMQLEWAKHVPGRVLILAPLAVAEQTKREGEKFHIPVVNARNDADAGDAKIVVTNYEILHHFDISKFNGIVLDESSILKSFDGKTRNSIIRGFANTPFRLACTATPAPNDFMELGNHSEFMGALSYTEMLSTFFVHDGGETQKWRLKGHANSEYWKWLCNWAVMLRKPSDLGYSDEGFELPPINYHHVIVKSDSTNGYLFPMEAQTLQERISARRESIDTRALKAAELANGQPMLFWCNLNGESKSLTDAIPGAVEVKGSDSNSHKEKSLMGFSAGEFKYLVTKPSIAGFGMNWQHCSKMVFVGLSDSYEQFYQATRRCWRFGQTKPVDVYIVTADTEGAVVQNIKKKDAAAKKMADSMVEHMHDLNTENIRGTVRTGVEYMTDTQKGDNWEARLGDCVEQVQTIDSDSIHYTIFSPPFASLYTYSASDRDMGNCRDQEEFITHFNFLVGELMRVTKPGRLLSFHCMNLPTSKVRNGYIGITDFRGDLIRLFEKHGWIYHSEVCIWKDPVTAMQRTKALGLLHKQLVKDSTMSRQGVPDYLVTMRKPGENKEPVSGKLSEFVGEPDTFRVEGDVSIDIWQRYASPVWMDIRATRTLQYQSARENDDERHICPLQLDVIERGLQLWTNPNDLVLSPFAGIGSEGYCAVKMGRRFVGIELKRSYFDVMVSNLNRANTERTTQQNLALTV